jgi:hypothetical protein
MAKLSKVDAAKAAGVSRQTLYTYIKDGRLSVDADGLIDTAELLRAGFALRTVHETGRQDVEPVGQPLMSTSQPLTSSLDTLDVYRDMISMLKQQLNDAQAREQAALERERSAREREAHLLRLVEQMQQRYDRLLDMPRSAAPAQAPPPVRTARPQKSGSASYDPSPAIARILTLRQQGMSFERIAAQLDADGIPTRYGLPWQHSSVRHLFRTYGQEST